MRKTLTNTIDLAGQRETITAMEFRRTPGDVLLQAQMGKVFEITIRGVIVAVLSAPEPKCVGTWSGSPQAEAGRRIIVDKYPASHT